MRAMGTWRGCVRGRSVRCAVVGRMEPGHAAVGVPTWCGPFTGVRAASTWLPIKVGTPGRGLSGCSMEWLSMGDRKSAIEVLRINVVLAVLLVVAVAGEVSVQVVDEVLNRCVEEVGDAEQIAGGEGDARRRTEGWSPASDGLFGEGLAEDTLGLGRGRSGSASWLAA